MKHAAIHASTSWNLPQSQFVNPRFSFSCDANIKICVSKCFESSFSSNIIVNANNRYFQFGVIERAIVEIICVWLILFITCWIRFAQGLKNEIQLAQRRHWNANFKSFSNRKESYEDLNIVLQFILNNSWSVCCCLKIQDSYLRIRIKRRIFKKERFLIRQVWSTSVSQVLHTVILNVLYYVS